MPALVVWVTMAVWLLRFRQPRAKHHRSAAFSGVVTAVPLLFFGWGAGEVPLTTLGILQYIAPTMQFAMGFLFYREPFD